MNRSSQLAAMATIAAALVVSLGMASPSSGHQGHAHVPKAKSVKANEPTEPSVAQDQPDLAKALPFPSKIGGNFNLIDQTGARRQLADFSGKPIAIFFGYATCQAICTVALPRMAEMVDKLAGKNIDVTPVLITVDPERDTPESMRKSLPKYHEQLVGLTGTRAEIDAAQAAFQVESKVVYTDPDGGDIFAHGSFIYLMNTKGKFLTLFPPILSADRMAVIAEKYLNKPQS